MITAPTGWLDFYAWSSVFQIKIDVTLTNTAQFALFTNNIRMGTLSIDDQICEPGELKPGSMVAQVLNLSVINTLGMYNGIEFRGARLVVWFNAGGGDPICRGSFYVDEAQKNGSYIDIIAYGTASKYDVADLAGYDLSGKTAVTILNDILDYDGIEFDNINLPNATSYVGNYVVGAEGSPLPEDITRRELAQYICEFCGGYIRCYTDDDGVEHAVAYGFPVFDYTDDLDGGDFTYEGSPSVPSIVGQVVVGEVIVGTANREDDADGGLFLAPFVKNLIQLEQGNWNEWGESSGGGTYDYDMWGINNKFTCTGTNTASEVVHIEISEAMHLQGGKYRFGVIGLDMDTYRFVISNETRGTEYRATNGGVEFSCDNPTDTYKVYFITPSSGTLNIEGFIYICDAMWQTSALSQLVWQTGDAYDGGFFGFWNITNPSVYGIPKIIEYPIASERIAITMIAIIGSGFNTVTSGSNEGAIVQIYNNPFINSSNVNTIASHLLSALAGVTYHKFNVSWSADPRVEAGDMVCFRDKNGNIDTSPCTGMTYRHGQFSNVFCAD